MNALSRARGVFGTIIGDLVWLGRQVARVIEVALGLMLFVYAWRLAHSRSDTQRYEGHGYFIWALALWTFTIPELYGSFAGKNGRIPTLSNTVGNLLNLHDWMSLFVVAFIFFGVTHIAKVQAPARRRARQQEQETRGREADAGGGRWCLTAAQSGRITDVQDEALLPVYVRYEMCAIALTVIAFLLPLFVGASKQVVGESGYAMLFAVLFVVPGLLAYRHKALASFPGLFTTMLNLERKSPPLAFILGAGLVFLAIHLTFYPFPSIIPDIQGLHHHCDTKPKPAICINPPP
jgi:hypothetical protein